MDAGRKQSVIFSAARVLVPAVFLLMLSGVLVRADWPTPLPAETAPKSAVSGTDAGISNGTLWGGVLGAVGLLVAWGLVNRHRRQMLPGAGSDLTVLSRLVVGPRQSFVLLRCGRRRVLVGITPQQFTALGEWPDTDLSPEAGTAGQRETLLAIAERLGVSAAPISPASPAIRSPSKLEVAP